MSLRIALLGMLATGPASGYDLTKRFDGSLGYVWHARHSQIYPELAKLTAEGLVTVTEEGPRGRKTYELTEAGRATLDEWLAGPGPDAGTRSESFLRLFLLPLLDGDQAPTLLRRQAEQHDAKVALLTQVRDSTAEPSSPGQNGWFALDLGIRQMSAIRDWATDTADRIERLASASGPGPGPGPGPDTIGVDTPEPQI